MKDVTEFEEVSDEVMNDDTLDENCIYWKRNDKVATVNFTQGRYITKVKQLAEKYPDRVKIRSEKNGVLLATIPVKAIQISIREVNLTEEQRSVLREHARNVFHKG